MVPATILVARSYKDDAYRALLEKKVFEHNYSAESVIVTLSIAISLYNSLELLLAITTTFKKWRGLYFWSMLISTLGVILYALGMMLMYFELCILWLSKVILDVGWIMMVVFQSLVLYSRLGLVLDSDKILQAVWWMIMFNSFTLVILTVIFDFGTTYAVGNNAFPEGYYYVEHIQVTFFCFQELVISSLYLWKAADLLKITLKARTRRTMFQLFIMNVVIIAMDIALIVLQYKHLQLYQESIKVFVYSVKLKLELSILSKLADLVRGNRAGRSTTLNTIEEPTINGHGFSDAEMTDSGDRRPSMWFGSGGNANGKDSVGGAPDPKRATSFAKDFEHSETSDEASRSGLQPIRTSARTSGRETDLMYAEFLSSCK